MDVAGLSAHSIQDDAQFCRRAKHGETRTTAVLWRTIWSCECLLMSVSLFQHGLQRQRGRSTTGISETPHPCIKKIKEKKKKERKNSNTCFAQLNSTFWEKDDTISCPHGEPRPNSGQGENCLNYPAGNAKSMNVVSTSNSMLQSIPQTQERLQELSSYVHAGEKGQ